MRNAFIRSLQALARKDKRVVLVVGDLGFSVVEPFQEEFPDRFFNVGIQEQNGVSVAAGLAMEGFHPFFYSIVPFATMRPFEQIRVDVAYMKNPVRIVGVGAGLGYGPAGATHHAIEDSALMRLLPGMQVWSPGDPLEVEAMVELSAAVDEPIYFRLGKGGDPQVHVQPPQMKVGQVLELKKGSPVTLLATSTMLPVACEVLDVLKSRGLSPSLFSVPFLKPCEIESVIKSASHVISLEEHQILGGLGSLIADEMTEKDIYRPLLKIGLESSYTHKVGSQKYLRKQLGLDAEAIAQRILDWKALKNL